MSIKSSSLVGWLPKAEKGARLRRGSVYESGNLTEGLSKIRGGPSNVYVSSRFTPYSIDLEDDPQTAYNKIVADAGANLQVATAEGDFLRVRDSVDQRIMNNLVNRTGTFYNGVGHEGRAGFPEISWPSLKGGEPAADQDNDGMPDAWESEFFGVTSFGSSDNSSSDFDGDGYTDLEEYLYGTNPTDGAPLPPTAPSTTSQSAEEPWLPVPPTGLLQSQPILANTIVPASYTKGFCPDVVATVNLGGSNLNTLDVVNSPKTYTYHGIGSTRFRGTPVTRVILRLNCSWVE